MKDVILRGCLLLGLIGFGLQADVQPDLEVIDNLKPIFSDFDQLFSKSSKRHELESIIEENDLEGLEECLEHGLNPGVVMHIAIGFLNVDAVKLALKYGAPLNSFHNSFRNEDTYFPPVLCSVVLQQEFSEQGTAVTIMRNRVKAITIMKILLKAGADVNASSCEAGADVNALYCEDGNSLSPLLWAIEKDDDWDGEDCYDWMIEFLLLAGANPHQICTLHKDGEDRKITPFEYALEKGNANIIALFEKFTTHTLV